MFGLLARIAGLRWSDGEHLRQLIVLKVVTPIVYNGRGPSSGKAPWPSKHSDQISYYSVYCFSNILAS